MAKAAAKTVKDKQNGANKHTGAMLDKFLAHYEALMAIPAAINRVDGLIEYTLKVAKKAGFAAETLHDGTVRVSVPGATKTAGKNIPRRIAYGAHLDRIGLMVDKLHEDGRIEMSGIGGFYPGHVIDGTVAKIVTKNETFAGVITHVEAPIHSLGLKKFENREQSWKKLRLRLDAGIGLKKDGKKFLKDLGIECGQLIWLDNALSIDRKYKTLRSRWVDNTMAVATLLALMETWGKGKNKPTYDTDLVFTVAEESGMGGSSVAGYDVTDFVAVDVSLGEEADDMYLPSLSVKAGPFPYSSQLIEEMDAAAKHAKFEIEKHVITGGGTDAEQARRAGFTGRVVNMGVPVYGMHSIESCTFDALEGLLAVIDSHAMGK